ncbi:MAG: ORF6N domain-containing protein [Bacteroidales bacterium]|nr:ORF6N domain-containing protein [Bacteroidales bacterium]MBN2697464.1 ORF6N domain-containing protein [Bacteroidales bacterium]
MTIPNRNSDIAKKIDRAILFIRGQKVMIDSDLAEIFGVKTYRLNEQVKRNRDRFPEDFMFQLTAEEKQEVIANCDHLEKIKFSSTNPYAFTEHGTIMLANVLNTPTAVETSLLIVRAFVKLRVILSTHKELEKKILELESKYDKQFKLIFKAIRELMRQEQLDKNRPGIGYKIEKGNKIS